MFCWLCRPEPEEGVSASATSQKQPSEAPTSQPQMSRSKSEVRILRLEVSDSSFSRSQSMPPPSLLQASRRRLLAAEHQEAAAAAARQSEADGKLVEDFIDRYMTAIKDSNASWATQPEVGEMFQEDARMIAADKQSFHGRTAIVRRLNQGVDTLAKMAGEHASLPGFELTGPSADPSSCGSQVVKLTIKRGMHRITFTLHFTMQQGKIAVLRNTRS